METDFECEIDCLGKKNPKYNLFDITRYMLCHKFEKTRFDASFEIQVFLHFLTYN